MIFERTRDYKLVKEIVTHSAVWRRSILSDHAPARENFSPRTGSEEVWHVVAREAGRELGLFILTQQNPVCWDAHVCMLPRAWGRAAGIVNDAARWLGTVSSCRKLIATAPVYNRLCVKMLERAGWTRLGVNTKSILKDGCLHDQIVFQKEVSP